MSIFKKVKKFWVNHESKLIIITVTALIAFFSFQVGTLKGQKQHFQPLIVEKPAAPALVKNCSPSANHNNSPLKQVEKPDTHSSASLTQKCVFVGSKNSNKYHYPDCHWTKKIKPENRVCFSGAEEARQQGYIPASCIKKRK